MNLIKDLKWGIRALPRLIGHSCFAPEMDLHYCYRILLIGVCLAYKRNYYQHLKYEFGKSVSHRVNQKWIVIDPSAAERVCDSGPIYEKRIKSGQPRMNLLNSLLHDEDLSAFDFLIITDDDIKLPKGFLDAYLATNADLGFSLSQPARTANSYISHGITRRVTGLFGRQTNFVEVGPLVCISNALFADLLPFDRDSGMGFGLDAVWPTIVQERKLTMGIIDSVPVDHSLRPPGNSYDFNKQIAEMGKFLSMRKHLTAEESFVTMRKFSVNGRRKFNF